MKNRGNQPLTIDAPVGGENRILAPNRMPLNQARELINYLCTDAGIEEFGNIVTTTIGASTAGLGLTSFLGGGGTPQILWSSQVGGVYRLYYSPEPISVAGIETVYGAGAQVVVNAGACKYPAHYGGYVYFTSETNATIRFDPYATQADLAAWAPVSGTLTAGTGYKNRFYAISDPAATGLDRFTYHYSALKAITGAMTAVSLSGVVQGTGRLQGISNWTFNPGNANDEYLVIGTASNEILIYSGTDPGAANWGIVAKVRVPSLVGEQPFIQVGADLLCHTRRGIISLSSLLAGRDTAASYVTLTRNIKDQIGATRPFFWRDRASLVCANLNQTGLRVQNIETGAWSQIVPRNATGATAIATIINYASPSSTLLYGLLSTGEIILFKERLGQGEEVAVWKTPFIGASGQNQRINKVKIQAAPRREDAGLPIPQLQASGAIETYEAKGIYPEAATPPQYDFNAVPISSTSTENPAIVELNLNVGATADEWSLVAWNTPTTASGGYTKQTVYGAIVWVEDTGSID
jgi:hypothetical protein